MLPNRLFKKYFKRHSYYHLANPNVAPKKNHYQRFIVIPCYDEYDYIFKTLDSINLQDLKLLKDTLIVIVINNACNDNKKSN